MGWQIIESTNSWTIKGQWNINTIYRKTQGSSTTSLLCSIALNARYLASMHLAARTAQTIPSPRHISCTRLDDHFQHWQIVASLNPSNAKDSNGTIPKQLSSHVTELKPRCTELDIHEPMIQAVRTGAETSFALRRARRQRK